MLSSNDGDGQPPNLAAGYLLELRLPAFAGLGDKEQNQPVPRFAKLVVGRVFHTPTVPKTRIG